MNDIQLLKSYNHIFKQKKKKQAKKKVLSIPTQNLTPCNYTRHKTPWYMHILNSL